MATSSVNIQTRGIQYKISQSEQDEAGEILSESKTYTIGHTVAKITKTRGSVGSARAVLWFVIGQLKSLRKF
jgi:hypothetical protein